MPVAQIATTLPTYAVKAIAPTAASGKVSVGSRAATTRHTAITTSATPVEPAISNVVPLCGAAPLNEARLQPPASSTPSRGPSDDRPSAHHCVVSQPPP